MRWVRALLFFTVIWSSFTSAANIEHVGKVTDIFAYGSIFKFKVCNSANNCKQFWLKVDSDKNKAVFSLLLTAKTTQNSIWIMGADGQPSAWPYYGAYKYAAMHLKNN